ncbi:MAG: segregation/condensation protein A [Clostridiaceae bacterium]|nr:segregation/condensation protein A [Clostridiaceae bacterium]
MPLNVKTLNFEGPFDLLLHLIKKNEMDIYDIKIYDITTQYLDYLYDLKEMDLDITSEFIVIAATLIEIKSKMLLPKEKKEAEEVEEIDPRKELVEKLLEYKKFKFVSQFLKEREVGLMFSKKPEIIPDPEHNFKEIFKDITLIELLTIYNELMDRFRNKMNTENIMEKLIPLDAFKIEDKMIALREILFLNDKLSFKNITKDYSSKIEVVVTFLAMLEMIKIREIKVTQYENFNEIYLERIIKNEES